MLATPYLLEYDLVALGVAIALMAREGLRSGFLPGERAVLLLAWIVPIAGTALAEATAVQVGPAVMAALLALIVRRVHAFSRVRGANAVAHA